MSSIVILNVEEWGIIEYYSIFCHVSAILGSFQLSTMFTLYLILLYTLMQAVYRRYKHICRQVTQISLTPEALFPPNKTCPKYIDFRKSLGEHYVTYYEVYALLFTISQTSVSYMTRNITPWGYRENYILTWTFFGHLYPIIQFSFIYGHFYRVMLYTIGKVVAHLSVVILIYNT